MEAKRKGEQWAKDIPLDINIFYADSGQHRCFQCGSPYMEDCGDAYTCRKCFIKTHGEEEYQKHRKIIDESEMKNEEKVEKEFL